MCQQNIINFCVGMGLPTELKKDKGRGKRNMR